MIAHVRVVTPEQYTQYIDRRKQQIQQANQAAGQQRRQLNEQSSADDTGTNAPAPGGGAEG
jgi:heme/copper-type cytochrome/quinol oxidase subunit 2